MDAVSSLLVVVDRGGRVVWFNRACELATGYSSDEVRGKFFWDLLASRRAAATAKQLFDVPKLDAVLPSYEVTWVARDGKRRLIGWSVRVLSEGNGADYLVGTGVDISERKRPEQALGESDASLRGVFENIRDVFYRVDLGGVIQMVSPSVSRYGYRPDELIGIDSSRLFIGATERGESLHLLKECGEITDFEMILERQDGGTVPVSVNAHVLRDRDGNLVGIEGLVRDISERKRMENALRNSEANFRGIFENIQDVFYRLDLAGKIQLISPSVSQFGYTADELTGASVASWHDVSQRDRFLRALLERGEITDAEAEVRCKDGNVATISTSAHLLSDDDGQLIGIEGTVRDISERKNAEEAARQHRAELAHVLRFSTMGEMAAGLAHEINQPLAAIANYASGCARRIDADTPGSAQLSEAVGQIAAEALRAGEIIRRLRALVSKAEPQRESVDLNDLVREVVRSLEAEASRQDVSLELDLAPSLPRLDADGIQIQQVFSNLVRNGLEAMDDQSCRRRTLAIRTAASDSGAIAASVCDSGTGLPPGLESQVFEPFFSTKAAGLGMGLAISRSIVEAHGGRLWATANPDGGATVSLTLPASNSESADAGWPI